MESVASIAAGSQPSSSSSRLCVVANRLPVVISRNNDHGFTCQQSAGGLVTALLPIMEKSQGLWMGWPGLTVEFEEQSAVLDALNRGTTCQCHPVFMSPEEVEDYYEGMANKTIWPLFHSLTRFTTFSHRFWDVYVKINQCFADEMVAQLELEPDAEVKPIDSYAAAAASSAFQERSESKTILFVQDYHLLLLPAMLRTKIKRDARAAIAFFLHIPFPSFDILRALPWAEDILVGLLGSDLIGFHTQTYATNFLDAVRHLLGARARVGPDQVIFDGRCIRVGAFSLGIPFDKFVSMATALDPKVSLLRPLVDNTEASELPQQYLLGVDRLDYSKGIPERINAFRILLEQHPELFEKVSLVQIAVPSRENISTYLEQKREIDHLIGQVNGQFGTATWQPITYIHKNVPQSSLAVLYRDAAVCLVTPVRDGMNLVAKEFCACQINEPGVLILSSLTGAAETMREALLVNPYDAMGVANMIHRALNMSLEERSARMQALRAREQKYDVSAWINSLLGALASHTAEHAPTSSSIESSSDVTRSLRGVPLNSSAKLCIAIDYDGILAEFAATPEQAVMDSDTSRLVVALNSLPNITVVISSGRSLSDLRDNFCRSLMSAGVAECPKDFIFCANHGLEIQFSAEQGWQHPDVSFFVEKAKEVADVLREIQAEFPGSAVEEKGIAITFHFRNVDGSQHGLSHEVVSKAIANLGFRPVNASPMAVDAVPPTDWDHGRSLHHILRALFGKLWSDINTVGVIYIGNDESCLRSMDGLARTFLVGDPFRISVAKNRLLDAKAVRHLLSYVLEKCSGTSSTKKSCNKVNELLPVEFELI